MEVILWKIFSIQIFNFGCCKIEVLGFDDAPTKMANMEEFVNTATVLSLDEAITKQTILLRRQYKKLKLGDAIISATALVYNLTLITHNTSDFKNINGLHVIDLYDL
ncbi:MAG: type II toxin-antitoxin system VapC family toxin [Bacteroidetes bacterium]|nr:type II toxin-antitoxin system VapC family toxin [Bacteroidota bacterium]